MFRRLFLFVLCSAVLGADLPDESEPLLQAAAEAVRANDPETAAAAFSRFLERHADHARAEEISFELARLLGGMDRLEAAMEVFAAHAERFAGKPSAWRAHLEIGDIHRRRSDAARALAEYRFVAREARDAQIAAAARRRIWDIEGKHLSAWIDRTYTPEEEAYVTVSAGRLDSVRMRSFAIPHAEIADAMGAGECDLPAKALALREGREPREESTLYFRGSQRHQERRVSLGKLPSAVYVIEVEHDGVVESVVLPVTRHGVMVLRDGEDFLVFVQERTTGRATAGAEVHVPGRAAAAAGEDGLARVESAAAVRVRVGGEWLFSAPPARGTRAADLFHVVTDRPVYRPGHDVRYALVHRVQDGARLETRAGLEVRVSVTNPRGEPVHEQALSLDADGHAGGSFALGEDAPLGAYTVTVADGGRAGSFLVDEYRKPDFRVDVAFQRPPYLQGEEIAATISAEYHFGSPVAGAEVQWRLHRRDRAATAPAPLWRAWYCGVPGRAPAGPGEVVASGSGRTDVHGNLVVRAPAERRDRDSEYTLSASVADASRRLVGGSASTLATRARIALSVEPDRRVYAAGSTVRLLVRARDLSGAPAKNLDVAIAAAYVHGGEEVASSRGAARTGGDGVARVEIDVPQAGELVVRATATDAQGRLVTEEARAWVADESWVAGPEGLRVVPDREAYAPGDEAVLLLVGPGDADVLLTLEGDRIHYARVVRLEGGAATVRVPLDEACVPNVHVVARTLAGGAPVDATASVAVDPASRWLDVEVAPDRARYEPRDRARMTFTTRGPDGAPREALVLVAVVDEAVHALAEDRAPDIRRFFVRERDRVDRRGFPEPSLRFHDGKRAEDGGDLPPLFVRSEFADTALWRAVRTDADGTATIEVPALPDDLTTWRVTARAITRGGLVGQTRRTFAVRKDLLVRLLAPRFLTEGDETTITAVVRNDLDAEVEVQMEIVGRGLELEGDRIPLIRVDAAGERRIEWRARALRAGEAELVVRAMSHRASDAMRLVLPVHAHAAPQRHAAAGLLESRVVTGFSLQDPSDAAAEIAIASGPAGAALEALETLAAYPYGCTEQTMSRFLPAVVALDAFARLGAERPALEKELPHMTRAGLKRLASLQHADGGWGWWRDDATDPLLTAHVVRGLASARDAGAEVDRAMFARGLAALRRLQASARTAEERVYLAYALAAAGEASPNGLPDVGALPPAGKAMAAIVLARAGEGRAARRVLESLEEQAQREGEVAWFAGAPGHRWTGDPVEASAFALEAFLAADPHHRLVPEIAAGLALARDGHAWRSTRQTAAAVHALARYAAHAGSESAASRVVIELNGVRLAALEGPGAVKVDPALLREGDNEVVLSCEKGRPVWTLFVRSHQREDEFAPSGGALRVSRRYFLVVGGERQELRPGAVVRSGEVVEAVLRLEADRPHAFLMLEDPLPAGFEPVRDAPVADWVSHLEMRDEKVAVAVSALPAGAREVVYRMRAETPGTYRALPARVWDMYRPADGASGAGFRIGIRDR